MSRFWELRGRYDDALGACEGAEPANVKERAWKRFRAIRRVWLGYLAARKHFGDEAADEWVRNQDMKSGNL